MGTTVKFVGRGDVTPLSAAYYLRGISQVEKTNKFRKSGYLLDETGQYNTATLH